jgi:RimJ/RimL family protein N-acetyltransferase
VTVALRAAGADDVPFLLALRTHPAVVPFLAPRAVDAAALRAEVAEPAADAGRLIVLDDDQPVGALAWRVANERSRIVELREVMLVPEARGRGLARAALLAACRRLAAERDAHRFQLEVYGFNTAAQRAFEHAGFVREGVRRRAYWRRDAWQDGVLYGLLVDELPPP